MKVTNQKELKQKLNELREAQKKFATYTQEQVDKIFKQCAIAAAKERINLAKLAVEETGIGLVEDKIIKNHFAAEYIYNKYKNEKTCGIIDHDDSLGITKVAEPIGIVAAIVPTTNPTSTAIFKSLISLKTRNAIFFSPHPRAKKSTIAAAKLILDAAVKAGAPKNIIGWIDEPSIELSQDLMSEADIILATGGPSMVKAAYSSGKPAIGVGAGNTPAIIDESADIDMAVSSIILSKTYDNGVICASEQSILVMNSIYEKVKEEFVKRGSYILNQNEIAKIKETMFKNGAINADIVGKSAYIIAKMAGIEVPQTTKILIGEVQSVEKSELFSHEKLSPVLAMYKVKDFDEALKKAQRLIELGGSGHTSSLYIDSQNNKDKVKEFGLAMKTSRTFINMPSSQGASGDLYNFAIAPSFTLGCGTWGGNSVSQNVEPKHLLNIKSVAERRENMLWFKVPQKIYFKYGCLRFALKELKDMNKKRAFIVTDKDLFKLGYVNKITKVLDEIDIKYSIFTDIKSDPTIDSVKKGAKEMLNFEPDTIISIGGGSPMDAAKVMHLLYEYPEAEIENLAINFMDIRKRICNFPKLGTKAISVAIPTTAGTGSEATPFAVITNDETGMKYPLTSYELTPNMAIIDTELMLNMPRKLTAATGIDALVHAIEAYVSVMATDYTDELALRAIKMIFKYLPRAYKNGTNDIEAREKMAHASNIAGMAFANAFLGVCHSMAHKLGAMHHVPHGIACAVLIEEVIKYNATDCPTKQTAFPQYKSPNAKRKYAEIAEYLNLKGTSDTEKVTALIEAISKLKIDLSIPQNISAAGINKKDFYNTLDKMSELAFDDQCTTANPRYPLISELKDIYIKSF
ncbi:acetaldehyde dehydrogenase/alcohol dehydrogenase [Clostridium acetobutylicum]|uniref:Aldehyde-alcohol dehydrogenase n=3 Tax=Clostridium TaxID=1485 RepID=Q7DFN2_CLOAB|nr:MULTISPECIES: bifunctional acetaldehyde-CoA/alcohol dehydrogenase [Clostridium]AKZ32082.1 aldehyde/alcohol dehydrogenase B [Clostridium sp. BOH3]QDZ36411.1 AdhE [Expression vector BT01]QEG96723.1 Ca_AdhE [Expression vector BT07]QEG96746.1 Ca_AdhE [Expression vector BT10]QFX78136.1 Ca_AdhE [Expression vector BT04]QVN25290.1 AdhE2 [Vector pPM921]